MTPSTWLIAATALAATLALDGCSVQRWAINKAGDALSGDSAVIARDDDPDFVRAAASGFTQYSYAFVQLDADMLEDQDYAAATRLRQRARRLYVRARDYG